MIFNKLYHLVHDFLKPINVNGFNNETNFASRIGSSFIVYVNGNNNKLIIKKNCRLTNTRINISGENNNIIFEDDVRIMGPCKIIMGGNATLHIKKNAGIRGVEFNLFGANIEVGELCMFSYGITVRNHDSHKIIDVNSKKIINHPKNIIIGNHVWIAQNATILKGVHVGDNSVIGFGSIVTKSCENGSIIAGIPAKIVKEGITWDY